MTRTLSRDYDAGDYWPFRNETRRERTEERLVMTVTEEEKKTSHRERAYAQLKSRAPSFRESREFRLQDERNSRQQDLHLKDELHLCMLSSFHLLQHMDGKLLLNHDPFADGKNSGRMKPLTLTAKTKERRGLGQKK